MIISDIQIIHFHKDTWIGHDKDGHMHPCRKRTSTAWILSIITDQNVVGRYLSDDIWQTPSENYNESVLPEDGPSKSVKPTAFGIDLALNKIRPILIGEDPLCREKIFAKLFRMQRLGGSVMIGDDVLAAIDIALWDLFGNLVNLPIYKILGGHRKKLAAYGSIMVGDNYPGGLARPEDYASFAARIVKRGYKGVKLHTWMDEAWADNEVSGCPNVERDLEACRQVRASVGDKIPLLLDPFHNYSREQALFIGSEIEKLNFEWMEEPMDEYDIESYRWLTQKLTRLCICGPETAHGKGATRAEWIRSGACDIVRAGLLDVGGITPFMKIVHLCELNGMPLEVHSGGAATIQVMAAMPINGKYYERGLLHPFLQYDTLPPWLNEPTDWMDQDGYVHVPDRPGCGYSFNWDYINDNKI
jgi:L-alanine-DL-glutamate epimerase-like enolase superfamily enzyme